MAWCHQATSHYLSQCWPRSLSSYDVTRPQWINTLRPRPKGCHFADNIFKCIFLNENLKFKRYFTEMCSFGSNWQYVITGLDNGLAQNRWQAITWTNDGLDYWCIDVSFSLNELSFCTETIMFLWKTVLLLGDAAIFILYQYGIGLLDFGFLQSLDPWKMHMLPVWRNFCHWLHQRWSFWQTNSPKCWYLCHSDVVET